MSAFIGLDYGKRRIGIAVTNEAKTIAFALGTHTEGRDGSVLKFLKSIIEERNIGGIVLGLPLTTAGDEGEIVSRVRKFGQRLTSEFELPIYYFDERYSSSEARSYLQTQKKQRREDVDSLAAEIILQAFLEQKNRDKLDKLDQSDLPDPNGI